MSKGVSKIKIDHTGFATQYGFFHFLICVGEVSEKAKKSCPNGNWPVKGRIYSVKELYALRDEVSGTQVPFANLNEINTGKEGVGYLMFNFAPFPFSPN